MMPTVDSQAKVLKLLNEVYKVLKADKAKECPEITLDAIWNKVSLIQALSLALA